MNRLSRFRLTACLPALLVWGCAAKYVEPTGDKVALLAIENGTTEPVTPAIYGDAGECRNRSVIPSIAPGEQGAFKVAAGKDLAVTVTMSRREIKYGTTLVFRPEAGHRYLANLNMDAKAGEVLLSDITSLLAPKPVKATAREWIRASGDAGPWCKPAGQ